MGLQGDTTITLASAGTGSLFQVSEGNWTLISKRVGLAHLAEPIEVEVAKRIPEFPALATACDRWRTATFSGIVTQAEELTANCTTSIQTFARLQHAIANLDPDESPPESICASIFAAISSLHQSTVTLSNAIVALAGEVTAFRSANDVVDAQIARFVQELGPDWVSLASSTHAVEQAVGVVEGAWQAITADIGTIASGSIPITTQLLLSLGIASALLSWEHVREEAQAFPSMATGQTRYLDGSWLSEGH
ncbi:MAG: hypothetical protein ACLQBY_03325 [Solirubrobacteraceae bacterium]